MFGEKNFGSTETLPEKKLTGVNRVWEAACDKIREDVLNKSRELKWPAEREKEAMNFVSRLLRDENFKKEATENWETLLAETEEPEEKEKELINGISFRVAESMRNNEDLKEKGMEI